MTKDTIVQYWRQGHSREWLIRKEEENLKPLAKTKEEKKNVKWQAKHNVEEALLEWYRKEVLGK